MNLIGYSEQDVYLTGDPECTYYKIISQNIINKN